MATARLLTPCTTHGRNSSEQSSRCKCGDGSAKRIDRFVREFKPKWKYHATLAPKLVCSRQEERDLGPGWSDQYQHQEYPKCVYHPTKAPDGKIVKNLDEHKALGKGWYATPGDFPQTRAVAGQTVGEQADNKEVPAGIRDRRGTRMSCEASITPTAMQPLGQREREPKDAVKREDVLKRELNYAVESGKSTALRATRGRSGSRTGRKAGTPSASTRF
jgi:hypothetical protein